MKCAHCERRVDMTNNPPSSAVWCGPACWDAWHASRPEEAAKWTDVRDLTLAQSAELHAVLGNGKRGSN